MQLMRRTGGTDEKRGQERNLKHFRSKIYWQHEFAVPPPEVSFKVTYREIFYNI